MFVVAFLLGGGYGGFSCFGVSPVYVNLFEWRALAKVLGVPKHELCRGVGGGFRCVPPGEECFLEIV